MTLACVDFTPPDAKPSTTSGVSFNPAKATPTALFDDAIKVTPLDSATLVPELKTLVDLHPSYATATVYEANLRPAFGNTPTMPNGGHVGSVILNACLSHQAGRCQDPLSITFDYLTPSNMGQTFLVVRADARAGGRMHDVYTEVYQLQAPKNKDAETQPTPRLVQTVRSVALFGTFSTKGPSASDPGHYGPRLALEHTPAPHPKSWYLPPKICMLSQQFDLLVRLETDRRPRADHWIRHHPPGHGAQQHGDVGPIPNTQMVQGSSTLPLRSAGRRLDLASLPTLADFRRPAMENVLKADPHTIYDEPTRKWAYPTLSLTLRFLRRPADDEWMHVAWREHALHGRVTSEFRMEDENGEAVCVGNMDSVMVPFTWFKG